MKKRIIAYICMMVLLCGCLCGCNTEELGNKSFSSMEEMNNYLEGTWFTGEVGILNRIQFGFAVFNENGIKWCYSNSYALDDGSVIGEEKTEYSFEKHPFYEEPTYKHKKGKILGTNDSEIVIYEGYFEAFGHHFYKLTDEIKCSTEAVYIFEDFCKEIFSMDEYEESTQTKIGKSGYIFAKEYWPFHYGGYNEYTKKFEIRKSDLSGLSVLTAYGMAVNLGTLKDCIDDSWEGEEIRNVICLYCVPYDYYTSGKKGACEILYYLALDSEGNMHTNLL